LTALWLLLLALAIALLLAQALLIRRLRPSRSGALLPEDEPVQKGVLRMLDRPLGRPRRGREVPPQARVLVVTRDRRFRRVAQFLLVRQGFAVELGRSADAAVQLAERNGADVVLIDGSDSLLAAAQTLRRLNEQDPAVAVVVVSDAEEEPPQTLPVFPKWGAFESIVKAIEAARTTVARV
jgi:CheY-like chemotaxis protein